MRMYRQYMNRRGGFNRPLDPMKWTKTHHFGTVESRCIISLQRLSICLYRHCAPPLKWSLIIMICPAETRYSTACSLSLSKHSSEIRNVLFQHVIVIIRGYWSYTSQVNMVLLAVHGWFLQNLGIQRRLIAASHACCHLPYYSIADSVARRGAAIRCNPNTK